MAKLWEHIERVVDKIRSIQMVFYNPKYTISLYDYATVSDRATVWKRSR